MDNFTRQVAKTLVWSSDILLHQPGVPRGTLSFGLKILQQECVFLGTHALLGFFALVAEAEQMQQTVKNNPVKLFVKGDTQRTGILSHAVNADVKLCLNGSFWR